MIRPIAINRERSGAADQRTASHLRTANVQSKEFKSNKSVTCSRSSGKFLIEAFCPVGEVKEALS
jgi:hypothetical protein